MKIKKFDNVRVIAGKNKGEEGQVLSVDEKNNTVIVEDVNIVTKHNKPGQFSVHGTTEEVEAPIHVSNVQLIDPSTEEVTRIGYKFDDEGNKVRYAKKSGTDL
jgi:large subunit ribosomal protein L24